MTWTLPPFVLAVVQRAFLTRRAGASILTLCARLVSVETLHSTCTGQTRTRTGHTTSWPLGSWLCSQVIFFSSRYTFCQGAPHTGLVVSFTVASVLNTFLLCAADCCGVWGRHLWRSSFCSAAVQKGRQVGTRREMNSNEIKTTAAVHWMDWSCGLRDCGSDVKLNM